MGRLLVAVDAARRHEVVDWPDLWRTLVTHARRGRNGSARFRAMLDEHYGARALPDSAWNRQVATLMVDAGLPAPQLEHPIDACGITWRLDLAWPDHRLGIELQSAAWHLDRRSQRRDARKLRALQQAGWRIYPFTWSEWKEQPSALVLLVADALAEIRSDPDPRGTSTRGFRPGGEGLEGFGVVEGFEVLDRAAVDDVGDGQLDDLAAAGPGDVGDLGDDGRDVAG
jgi:hypothetical protein